MYKYTHPQTDTHTHTHTHTHTQTADLDSKHGGTQNVACVVSAHFHVVVHHQRFVEVDCGDFGHAFLDHRLKQHWLVNEYSTYRGSARTTEACHA